MHVLHPQEVNVELRMPIEGLVTLDIAMKVQECIFEYASTKFHHGCLGINMLHFPLMTYH